MCALSSTFDAVPAAFDAVSGRLRDVAYRLYYLLNDANHVHRLWARPKRPHGVRFRSYEPLARHCRDGLLGALLDRLDPGDAVLDVGAHTGVYTLAAAASDPTVRVVAFEPNPGVVDQLRANVAANGFAERVGVRAEGVGDVTGAATFYVSSYAELGSFRAGHAAAWDARVIDEVAVPIRRLDDLLAAGAIPSPDHLKIDVEGFGREALAGAAALLSTERPVTYFEPHAGGAETAWLREFFDDLGYERERVAEGWVFDP